MCVCMRKYAPGCQQGGTRGNCPPQTYHEICPRTQGPSMGIRWGLIATTYSKPTTKSAHEPEAQLWGFPGNSWQLPWGQSTKSMRCQCPIDMFYNCSKWTITIHPACPMLLSQQVIIVIIVIIVADQWSRAALP